MSLCPPVIITDTVRRGPLLNIPQRAFSWLQDSLHLMGHKAVFLTYFVVESEKISSAYENFAERVMRLKSLTGVEIFSSSKQPAPHENESLREVLLSQYEVEHEGNRNDSQRLWLLVTVVEVDDIAMLEEVSELLLMDDPDVLVDQYPSFVTYIEQVDSNPHFSQGI